MALTLMYITNDPVTASIAQSAGVDRIWIDMEYIGKAKRQGGMDTVMNHHTIDDIRRLRPLVTTSELMVRVNPIHDSSAEYTSSEQEIKDVISAGADIVMLPMFHSKPEVERFVRCVNGKAKVLLLLETAEAAEHIDDILAVDGVDEIHIGLNDLHLAYGKKFMFELLCDGTVDKLCRRFAEKGIRYGFGGIARLGYGLLPAENVIAEHYRLGSKMAILSRSFCSADKIDDAAELEKIFVSEVRKIREFENTVMQYGEEDFKRNQRIIAEKVVDIVKHLK